MPSAYRFAALAAILSTVSSIDIGVPAPWAPNDPLISIYNTSPSDICYKVEFTSGAFPTPSTCDSSPGIQVKAGQSVHVHTGAKFNGALTAISSSGVKGARHEINFSDPGVCWYDVDYELGMSDSTLGPADHRPRVEMGKQLPGVSGEQDTLAKANAAWPHTQNKAALLQNPKYIQQGPDGKLTRVYMDKEAPEIVVQFFQLTAEFTAYIGPGSVAGVSVKEGSVKSMINQKADHKSWKVDMQQMEILAY